MRRKIRNHDLSTYIIMYVYIYIHTCYTESLTSKNTTVCRCKVTCPKRKTPCVRSQLSWSKMAETTEFVYHDIQLFKSECLGSGSYGGVCKAKCDGLPCAAKIMHPTLFDRQDPGTSSYISKFQEECRLLSLARHPNVVQYLATYYDPDTQLPVLLMEICDESLTTFLERSPGPLSYHIQINICQDIAQALVYLHSKGLIHRHVTGNNVLMIAGTRAKITDFGMSRLATVNPRMTALTLCPGNVLYMSPEALDEAKSYTAKLDIFSFGVIVIQILTRKFPNPSDRFRALHDSSTEEEVRVVVPENERRKDHLEMIPVTHPLKVLSLQCLTKDEHERPSGLYICERMSELRKSFHYTESMKGSLNSREVSYLEKQLKNHELVIESKQNEAQEYSTQKSKLLDTLKEREQQIQQSHNILTSLESELEDVRIAKMETVDKTDMLARDLESMKKQLQLNEEFASERRQSLELKLASQKAESSARIDITEMTWAVGKTAPEIMVRGAAAVHGNTAYIRPANSNRVYSYRYLQGEEQWSQLPDPPNGHCCLAVIDGLITCVGGFNKEYKNGLLSFSEGKWCEIFPPMPTARMSASSVTTSEALVVAGGYVGINGYLDTVEVMKTSTKLWATVSPLPQKLSHCSAVACGDKLYFAGGFLQGKNYVFTNSKSVLTCSLTNLLASNTLRSKLLRGFSQTRSIWKKISSLPVVHSTLASFGGQVLAFGGGDDSDSHTENIYRYDGQKDAWSVVMQMEEGQSLSHVFSVAEDSLFVIGGQRHDSLSDNVYILK